MRRSGRRYIRGGTVAAGAALSGVAAVGQVGSLSVSGGAFDTSPFRQNTYGASSLYADPTKTSTGAGTFADPWTLAQAMANATAGDVVRILAGNSTILTAPNSVSNPAFTPANSGSSGSPIVFVTEYAASALVASGGKSGIATDPNRTQIRHAGSAPSISGGAGNPADTGGPTLGSNAKDYVIFDGFYVDMASAYIREDSGMIRTQSCTGVQFLNCAFKGADVTCASNVVMWRPDADVDTVFSNFYGWGFHNDPTGSSTPQPSLFCDAYGTTRVIIEHFDIDEIEFGIYMKGSALSDTVRNSCTVRYGKITNSASFLRFNALSDTIVSEAHHVLCAQGVYNSARYANDGIVCSAETMSVRQLLLHHLTLVKVDSADPNLSAALYSGTNGFGSNVTIRDSVFDIDSGTFGDLIYFTGASLPTTLDYNYYTKNGSTMRFISNGTPRDFATWQSEVSRDAHSTASNTSPFVDRAADDFNVTGSALTMSSTGGAIGAYGETSETVGVVS